MRATTLVGVLLLGLAFGARADAREIGPERNLCFEINALPPGEELVLRPGEYEGPCVVRNGGTAVRPLVIRPKDPRLRPRISYSGNRSNVLNIAASYVTIRGLAFGPTRDNIDAVRVIWGQSVTVEECEFDGLGGAAVVSNSRNSRGLTIRRNRIRSSHATAIYIGRHSGTACALEEVLVVGNYIHGVDAPDGQIGYGIQIKLNSWGRIRDNVIINTKGPGIMVYGATQPGGVSVVERNAVTGSRHSAGIVVGGGPAIVRNNVATDSVEGGIQLENYGRRGLLREIAVVHNTVYNNLTGGITLLDSPPLADVRLINNAAHALPGTPPYPQVGPGLLSLGNVDCSLAACFQDAEGRDFSPSLDSPLLGAGARLAEAWMPADDFTGRPRGQPASVGAFERPSGSIPLGFKSPLR